MSRPRLAFLGQFVLLSAILSPFGCADKASTGVVLSFSSELADNEISTVTVDWVRANGSGSVGPFATLRVGEEIKEFPASVTFYDQVDDTEPEDDSLKLTITIETPSKQKMIKRADIHFKENVMAQLSERIDFTCLDKCQGDEWCDRGVCSRVSRIEASSLPSYDEQAYPKSFELPACFDATASGACFAGASRQPVSGLFPDPENTERCGFYIPLKGAEADLSRLNVGVIWAEASGRFTVLDREKEGQEAPYYGWTASLPKDKPDRIEVLLPPHVCDRVSLRPLGRVLGVVYATGGCLSKTPDLEVCRGVTKDADTKNLSCDPGKTPATTVTTGKASSCRDRCFFGSLQSLPAQKKAMLLPCLGDPLCRAIVSCYATCPTGNEAVECKLRCDQLPACDSSASVEQAHKVDDVVEGAGFYDQCQPCALDVSGNGCPSECTP